MKRYSAKTQFEQCVHCAEIMPKKNQAQPPITGLEVVVFAAMGGGKSTEVVMEAQLTSRRWCHLAIAHGQGGGMGAGTVRLFLDGQLAAAAKLRCV